MNITAIVPAHNEEKTIFFVVETLVGSQKFLKVMVVSDGSKDKTVELAKKAGAELIELSMNKGKGQAMYEGFLQTNAEYVGFFDADLINFSNEHIEKMISSLSKKNLDMIVGFRDKGKWITPLQKYLPHITGERIVKRSILEKIPKKYWNGFQIEPAINLVCRKYKFKTGGVVLDNMTIRRKYEKVGWLKAVVQYLKMFFQITHAYLTIKVS